MMQSQSHRRTLADIRSKVTERSQQNAISRASHAKNDSQSIASWKTALNRILLVFNVRFFVFAWSALTVHSQTELGFNKYAAISDVHDGVTKTHTVVSGVQRGVGDMHVVSEAQRDVADTHATVSEIRHEILESRKGLDDRRLSVNHSRIAPATDACSLLPRIKPGQ